jgi:Flp pilus assembly protein TadG
MNRRGQALVELAVCLPVLLILAIGAAQFVRLAVARTGLDAATSAAAAAAARAPSAAEAVSAGRSGFAAVAVGYGLDPDALNLDTGGFVRGGSVTATGQADVALGFSGIAGFKPAWRLTSIASARVEDWRSRPAGP